MMRHATKIGIAVQGDLETWQKLNVVAFLASGIAGRQPDLIGEPYVDGSGIHYLPIFAQPLLCYAADAEALGKARKRAKSRGLAVAIYTAGMFKTGNDHDNRAVVKALATEDLDLVGLAVHGDRKDVDKALKGLALHP